MKEKAAQERAAIEEETPSYEIETPSPQSKS